MYPGYGEDNWYVGATLGAGSLDYTNITRTIQLGAPTAAEDRLGERLPDGRAVLGGYWFRYDNNWVHGPWAKFTYDDVVVAVLRNGSSARRCGSISRSASNS